MGRQCAVAWKKEREREREDMTRSRDTGFATCGWERWML